jgi:hypothetical protein
METIIEIVKQSVILLSFANCVLMHIYLSYFLYDNLWIDAREIYFGWFSNGKRLAFLAAVQGSEPG